MTLIYFAVLAIVWIGGALWMEYDNYLIRKNKPCQWARRGDGLVSFSEKQYTVFRWVWPVSVVLFVVAYVAALVFAAICKLKELLKKKR